ncbi:MAG: hypothetical protein GH145_02310 [Firmicutes bacterium]|nr:hypothetical protein [Bacillota bacterium]
MTIPFAIPVRRGCGVRVEGGIYIVTDAEIEELADYVDMTNANIEGKLYIFPKPWPALVNLKPFRGFRGFDKTRFFKDININQLERGPTATEHFRQLEKPPHLARPRLKNCYYAHPEGSNAWLHWIGNQYYSIEEFIKEAELIGVSRRVPEKMLKKDEMGGYHLPGLKGEEAEVPCHIRLFQAGEDPGGQG